MKRLLLLLAVSVIGIIIWVAVPRFHRLGRPQHPPRISLEGLHPLVADAIRKGVGDVENAPSSTQAWERLAMLLLAHDFRSEARECLSVAERLDPKDFRWPYFRGYSFETSDFERALLEYSRAIELRPDYAPLRLRATRMLMRLRKLDRCESLIKDGEKLNPRNPYLRVAHARLDMLKGDTAAAEKLLESAMSLPDWNPQPALTELVKLAGLRKDYERAFAYQRQLDAFPQVAKSEVPDPVLFQIREHEVLSKDLAEKADVALAKGEFDVAIRSYERFLQERQDMSTPYVNLAQAHAMQGDYNTAIEIYRSVFKRFGDVVAAHMGMAATCNLAAQPELALKHYAIVLKMKPNSNQAWFQMGLIQEKLGREDEAIASYQHAVLSDESFPQPHLALGVLLMKHGRYKEARIHIQRAISLVPDDPIPQNFLRQLDQLVARESTGINP